MSKILKGLHESRSDWDSNMPGYQGDYGGVANWGRRNREDDEHHEIDAVLAARHAQRQEYERNGKFWLKLKDSQRHLPAGPFTGKQAANTAAVELLKQQPELKGNLLITAYGPDETQGVAEGSIGDKIKGAAKSVKRASQGWGAGGESDAVSPKDVVQAFGKMDGQRLANFVASRKDLSKPRNNSARAFADKVIDREMRQRGYGRVADKDEQGVAEGKEELHTQLQSINQKLKLMRGGPVGEPNSMAFVEKRKELLKQKEQILSQLKQGVAEGIPDVDHMNGPRGINLPSADTRDILQKTFEIYGNYEKWYRDVNRVNSELLDDNAEFSTMSGGKIISINGEDFAFWSNRNGNGSIDIGIAKKHSGQGVAEGLMNKIANKVMGAAPEQPKYKVGQRVKYETSPHQPNWEDGGRGVGVITAYKNGHYMINGNPVNHFEIKGVVEQGVAEGQLDELSNKTLASYKKKAGADATQADNRGDYARGNKRMSGIVKATKKEFDNDAKGVAEGEEQVYRVLAVDKSNALSKQVKLKVKASSLDEVFERLAINDWYPLEINGVEVINGKRLKQDVAEGAAFDKWADDRAASQLYKLKPATEWTVSYDYGPHMSKTVTVKAGSEEEARAKVEKAAEKKGMSIMINSVEPVEQGVAEGLEDKVVFKGHTIGHIETDSDGDPVGIVYSNNPQSKRPFEIYGYEDVNQLKREMISQWNKRVPKGMAEEKTRLDPKCWDGYKKQGTKMKGGVRVNNCVPVKESAIMKGLK